MLIDTHSHIYYKHYENQINEISWQRMKYQQFYEKSNIAKTDH